MKKSAIIVAGLFVALQTAFAGDVITHDAKQLPQAARNFISLHFADRQLSYIKIDSEITGKKYEVTFTDRTEIEFDSKGGWTQVDCERSSVPEVLVPAFIREYVDANYAGALIEKIELERHGATEIELNNGLSLKFDKKGRLTEIDD